MEGKIEEVRDVGGELMERERERERHTQKS